MPAATIGLGHEWAALQIPMQYLAWVAGNRPAPEVGTDCRPKTEFGPRTRWYPGTMNAMAEPLFTQNYCTLVPYQAGGALIAGRKQGCSVIVKDGDLILFTDQGEVDRAPLASVKIDTPAVQRKLGASTFVQMNDHRWTIDFGLAGRLDRPPKRGPIAAMKFARARNQEFNDLLRQGGAAQLRT